MAYTFDGKYGPIPNADGTVDLSNYASKYSISDTGEIIGDEGNYNKINSKNIEYLNEVFTNPNYKVINMSYMFANESLNFDCIDSSNWNTSNVTDMSYMFYNSVHRNIQNFIKNFNTSNVTDMSYMFCLAYYMNNLPEEKELDLSMWDTKNVLNMTGMFDSEDLYSHLEKLNIIGWDMNKVLNMDYFLNNCLYLQIIDGVIDISNCSGYKYILNNCKNLTSINIKLPGTGIDSSKEDNFVSNSGVSSKDIVNFLYENWNLDRNFITNAEDSREDPNAYKFDGVYGPIPNENKEIDLSDYARKYIADYQNITELPKENKEYIDEVLTTGKYNVTNMYYMFFGCISLTSLDVSNWDTSKVTDMRSMFYNCKSLTSIDVSNWNTSNVTDMKYMFYYCNSLTSIDVSNWDTSNVTDMGYVFGNCSSLTSLDISNWDTSNVTDMNDMFYNCRYLTSLDVSNWDTSNVTDMSSMFYNCTLFLTSLDVSNWDTSNVTDMRSMFYNCSSLTSIDVSNWDTSKVTNMRWMFNSCNSLTSIDVSNWDTSNVTDMSQMLLGCSKLTTIAGTIDLTSCTNYSSILKNTSSLTSINIKLPSNITQSDFLTNSKVTNKSAVHFVS